MKLHVEAVFDPKEESFMNSAGKDPLEVEVKEDVQLLKQISLHLLSSNSQRTSSTQLKS